MGMPPRAPKAGPITGRETIRMMQDGKPVLATAADLSGAGPQGASAYQVAVANGFQGTEAQWLASLQGQASKVAGPAGADAYEIAKAGGFTGTRAAWVASLKGEPGAASAIAGPTGLSAYEVAKAAGFTGTQAEWLASLSGPAGAPLRVETYTAISNAGSIATFTFPAFTQILDITVKKIWVGNQEVGGGVTAQTLIGCTVLAKRSKGTLLLTDGPFENAPSTPVTIVVLGR